ncbi:MAG: AEC family transporter [Coriobacteriales bacterium]|nr:AEC family transporter [Coriobacteriales bacterium]
MVFILIQQILVMVIMMSIGVALVKTKMINDGGVTQLSNIAMYVATPAVIIQAFAIDYNPEQLVNGLWVALFYAIALLLSVIIARLVCGRADRVGQYAVIFSNTGFVGIPIITSLLGPDYVFYVTMTMAVGTFVMWTYGIYLISGDTSQISFKKIATNPAVIALVVGLLLFFLPIDLPDVIDQVLTGMGNLNTGLAMLVLGANLGASNIGLMVADKRLYKACLLRLVVVPLVVLATLFLMPTSFEVRMMLFICEATPAGAATSMLAQMFGADYHYGTGLVIMSTLLSMISMPIVLALALQVL